MRIDHVAMYVCNLEGMKEFFVRFFGAHANEKYHNPRTGLQSYFLSFENGGRLEIMNRPDVSVAERMLNQQGYIHLAFSVGGAKEVDSLTRLLESQGYKVLSGPRTTGDGYYESCILGPEGNQIEITE